MLIDGCEARHATPVLEERICPDCGEVLEFSLEDEEDEE